MGRILGVLSLIAIATFWLLTVDIAVLLENVLVVVISVIIVTVFIWFMAEYVRGPR